MVGEIKFTKAARKHKIGRAHVRYVMATTIPADTVSPQGEPGWLYIGPDDRGIELEVVAVEIEDDSLLVIHAMPTQYRRN